MIRLAKQEDIPSILDLLSEVLAIHHELRPDIFKPGSTKYDEKEILTLLGQEDKPIFVYENSGKVVAHLFAQIIEHKETTNTYASKECYIDDLVVKSSCRRQGIGQKMIEFCKGFAKQKGCVSLTLHVWNGNAASEFYKAMGLTVKNVCLEAKL